MWLSQVGLYLALATLRLLLRLWTTRECRWKLTGADEFEVSMFLTETPTRHSILMKHKHFRDKVPRKMQSNSSKLLGETSTEPIDVDNAGPEILREEEDEISLDNIPELPPADTTGAGQSKRRRSDPAGDESNSEFETGSDDDVESVPGSAPPSKRVRRDEDLSGDDEPDKKKMAMDISYEGFAIYGRVLCLVIKRRGAAPGGRAAGAAPDGEKGTGQAVMENWISSTQVPAGMEDEAELGR